MSRTGSYCVTAKLFCVILSVLLLMLGSLEMAIAQPLARFTVDDVENPIATPVSVNLDRLTHIADTALSLQEVKGEERIPVPFQIEHGAHRSLWWMIKKEGNSTRQTFELVRKEASETRPVIEVEDQKGALVITDQGQQVLQYNYETVEPPEGVSPAFRRSGFIHPLWSPDPAVGEKLGDALQASDPKILDSEIGPDEIHLYESEHHHGNWLECIQSGETTIAPVEVAHRSCSACLLAQIAMKIPRKLQWDPHKERFIDDGEANAMRSRSQRYPYGTNYVKDA